MYALSLVLPVLGPSPDASGQLLYGYECFVYSHVMLALTLLEGHGDLKYSPLGLLLGCFANAHLFTLCALVWTRWRPTSRRLRIPLLLSVLSVLSGEGRTLNVNPDGAGDAGATEAAVASRVLG